MLNDIYVLPKGLARFLVKAEPVLYIRCIFPSLIITRPLVPIEIHQFHPSIGVEIVLDALKEERPISYCPCKITSMDEIEWFRKIPFRFEVVYLKAAIRR